MPQLREEPGAGCAGNATIAFLPHIARKPPKVYHLQVSAPLLTPGFSIPDRVLTVWTCASQPCANDVSSWRAITCHLPGSITTDSKSKTPDCNTVSAIPDHITSTSTPGAQQEPAADEVDSWGAATDAWGASPADDSVGLQNQEAFDFSDLEDALSNTVNCVTTKQPKQRDRDISQHQQQHASSCCLAMDVARHSLPGFYLHMTAEAAGASASLSAEDQHIAELVAAYQDETKQVHIMGDVSCSHLVFDLMASSDHCAL